MAIPVVSQPATPVSAVVGQALGAFAFSASGSPDVWTASPLPTGLTLNAATGEVTGTFTAGGVFTTSITGANADGTSAAVTMVWIIGATPPGAGLWSDRVLTVEHGTRQVTAPGIAPLEDGCLFSIARGDNGDFLVGLEKCGVLQDLGATVTIEIGLKQIEPESLVQLASAVATRVQTSGYADTTRYRIRMEITPENWTLLNDYERNSKVAVGVPVQIRFIVGSTAVLCSDTFRVEVMRDSVPD